MMYGAFSGLASFILAIVLYMLNKNPLGPVSWLGFWIPILFLVIGIQHHRDKDLGGYISYGRGVGTGVLITLFLSIVFCVLIYGFATFIGTDILEGFKQDTFEGLEKAKPYMGDTLYEQAVEETEKLTVGGMVLGEFQRKILGGIIMSLIIAAFMRKQKSIFEQPSE